MGMISTMFILLILFTIYFLPLVVAVVRQKRNTSSVAVVNIFLGWTLVGWVVAMVMAVNPDPYDYNPYLVRRTR